VGNPNEDIYKQFKTQPGTVAKNATLCLLAGIEATSERNNCAVRKLQVFH
jgi:hypothetical protein